MGAFQTPRESCHLCSAAVELVACATAMPGAPLATFAFKKVTFVAREWRKGGGGVLDILVLNTVTAQDNEM